MKGKDGTGMGPMRFTGIESLTFLAFTLKSDGTGCVKTDFSLASAGLYRSIASNG